MADVARVSLTAPELRAAAKALRTLAAAPDDIQTSTVEHDAAVSCLFSLLHAQLVDLGWRPQGLTLAPWAVESVARLLSRMAEAASSRPRPAKATLRRPGAVASSSARAVR